MLSKSTESGRVMGHSRQLILLICGQNMEVEGCQEAREEIADLDVSDGECGQNTYHRVSEGDKRSLPGSHVLEKIFYGGRNGESFICPVCLVLVWQRNLKFSPFFPTQ